MLRTLGAIAIAIAVGTAAPATASTTFALTGNDSINGTFGNQRVFTAGGISVRASGWRAVSNNGSYTAERSYLARFSNGLGVTSTGDNSGRDSLHTIDNRNGFDFVLFQFDRAVTLTGATLNTYRVNGSRDNDVFIGTVNTNLAWTSGIALQNNSGLLNDLIDAGISIKSGTNTPTARSFASYGQFGNLWLVGADFNNIDGTDAFKMRNLMVTPVPEPATWAMMIAGFGAVGIGLRRRRRQAVRFAC
jgi:hypothetical protein